VGIRRSPRLRTRRPILQKSTATTPSPAKHENRKSRRVGVQREQTPAEPRVLQAGDPQARRLVWRWGTEKWRLSCPDTRSRLPAYKRLGTRGKVRAAAFRVAPRPQALTRSAARTRTKSMAGWVSGVRPLASRDAGLQPAARLARSRCAARSACSPRATSRGQHRSMTTTWQKVQGARTTGGGRFPKLTVRIRFPSPSPHAKSVAAQADRAPSPMRRQRPSASEIGCRAITPPCQAPRPRPHRRRPGSSSSTPQAWRSRWSRPPPSR
jgi:hypothetical protein